MRTRPTTRRAVLGPVLGLACALAAMPAPAADLRFVDATGSAGIDHTPVMGPIGKAKGWITEVIGSGAAWLDYDGDGRLDLYLLSGSMHAPERSTGQNNTLYRAVEGGRFEDVTGKAGVGDSGWAYGVAVGDIDNDGDPDMYVANLGANVLYRNNGDGTFTDITAAAGVGDEGWGTSTAFLDADADGDLDLYVGNYVDFSTTTVPRMGTPEANIPICIFLGMPTICGPRGLVPRQDVFYVNNGDGTFKDATRESGMWLERPRYALGVVSGDIDNDGDTDLYVANDSVQNSLWRNDGGGRFTDIGMISLSALSADGKPQAGMGTDAGDYNADGWLDLVATNFSHDLNTIYRNENGLFFTDLSSTIGMSVTAMALSWGVGFQDFDHDTDLDLFIANGHIYPWVDDVDMGTVYRQRNHLFRNDDGRFIEIGAQCGEGMALERSFRGVAFADYDDDGDMDLLLTTIDEPAVLLRNDSPGLGHWLKVKLTGTRSNRDGIGARVSATLGSKTLVRHRKGGGSYLSSSDPRLHFGLGAATEVDRLEVVWPSGTRQVLEGVRADRLVELTEPAE